MQTHRCNVSRNLNPPMHASVLLAPTVSASGTFEHQIVAELRVSAAARHLKKAIRMKASRPSLLRVLVLGKRFLLACWIHAFGFSSSVRGSCWIDFPGFSSGVKGSKTGFTLGVFVFGERLNTLNPGFVEHMACAMRQFPCLSP